MPLIKKKKVFQIKEKKLPRLPVCKQVTNFLLVPYFIRLPRWLHLLRCTSLDLLDFSSPLEAKLLFFLRKTFFSWVFAFSYYPKKIAVIIFLLFFEVSTESCWALNFIFWSKVFKKKKKEKQIFNKTLEKYSWTFWLSLISYPSLISLFYYFPLFL